MRNKEFKENYLWPSACMVIVLAGMLAMFACPSDSFYWQDQNTKICYYHFRTDHRGGTSNTAVPCTPEVLAAINQPRK